MSARSIVHVFGCVFLGLISHAAVSAQRPTAPTFQAAAFAEPGTATVETFSAVWKDEKRNRDVPVKIYFPRGDAACPLIIFSHGLGGTREGYAFLGEHWAGHGYISVHPQHVGSDRSLLSDGGVRNLVKAVSDPWEFRERAADVSFVIDKLLELDRAAPTKGKNFPLHNRVDVDRIGMAGHSFGANTTVNVGGMIHPLLIGDKSLHDPRIKAIAPLSTPVTKNETPERLKKAYAGITIPGLHMTGTADDSPIGETSAAQRRLPYENSVNAERMLLTFDGGTHGLFGGRVEFRNRDRDRRYQSEIQQATTIFWEAYLREDKDARKWLLEPTGMATAFKGDAKVETTEPAKK